MAKIDQSHIGYHCFDRLETFDEAHRLYLGFLPQNIVDLIRTMLDQGMRTTVYSQRKHALEGVDMCLRVHLPLAKEVKHLALESVLILHGFEEKQHRIWSKDRSCAYELQFCALEGYES